MGSAMITGASNGIGEAIAEALAPTHTLLLAGRPSARLDAVAARLGATTWPMDLTDIDDIDAATEVLTELDVLVHNAGVAYPGRVAESTPDQWRATFGKAYSQGEQVRLLRLRRPRCGVGLPGRHKERR